jgi:putative PIN family toxin of toxin-antitoxin system
MNRVVIDTNVVVSALRSRREASFAILQEIGKAWTPVISVPLILEYESVGKREAERLNLAATSVDSIIRAFCFLGRRTTIYFRLRPFLPDPADEFLLELAVAGNAEAIVTHTVRHLAGAERIGIEVMTPGRFLRRIKSVTLTIRQRRPRTYGTLYAKWSNSHLCRFRIHALPRSIGRSF